MEKVFICYPMDDPKSSAAGAEAKFTNEQFVHRVSYYLNKQTGLESYCYAEAKEDPSWNKVAKLQLASCTRFVYFAGPRRGKGQQDEVETFRTLVGPHFLSRSDIVQLPDCPDDRLDEEMQDIFKLGKTPIKARKDYAESTDKFEQSAQACARAICKRIFESSRQPWLEHDGLPIGYPFDYEKSIIEEFVQGKGRIVAPPKRLEQGCPIDWPEVRRIGTTRRGQEKDLLKEENPLKEETIGRYRPEEDRVIVDARTRYHSKGQKHPCACLMDLAKPLTLMEAGPRKMLYYPRARVLRVGVVVSGGIAPGINSVISGIVNRHRLYARGKGYRLDICLYRDGFSGLLRGQKANLDDDMIAELADRGGSMISTSRTDELLDLGDQQLRQEILGELVDRLATDGIDILYIIGGDGSMRAAHVIWHKAHEKWTSANGKTPELSERAAKRLKEISVVGIPKTMDNDVLWVWQAFGFLSAVEKTKEFISQLDTETRSNPRLGIVQIFGSDSGFVVSHAALASNICRAALIPEVGFTLQGLSRYIGQVFEKDYNSIERRHSQSPHGIILLAETAIPRDVDDYIDNPDYPDLNLTEEEKSAIRRFIGSSLLSVRDIHGWQLLCEKIYAGQQQEESHPCRRVWDSLPQDAQAIMAQYVSSPREPGTGLAKEIQSLLTKALNTVLRSEAFSVEVDKLDRPSRSGEIQDLWGYLRLVKHLSTTEEKRLEAFLEYLLKGHEKALPNPLGLEPAATFKELGRYLLSYEAKETTSRLLLLMSADYLKERRFAEVSRNTQNIWSSHFKGYCTRLYKELIKTYNRLLFETIFAESISARRTPGECRVHGQTPDELRSGGLKIVSGVLQSDIQNCKNMQPDDYWKTYRVFVNEPRHLIRAIHPSVSDIIFGQRLGTLAVDNAMAGFTDFMVSQWLTEYVLVPLELVVLGRKRVPQQGIFWQSVLANTGQWAEMA